MKDRIDLALKIKERVISKNISLNSIKGLPDSVYNNLQHHLQNAIIIYKGTVSRARLEVLSERAFLLCNFSYSQLNLQEIIIVVLPVGSTRYVFVCKVNSVNGDCYEISILDPRSDERIVLGEKTPAFLSLIPKEFIKRVLESNEYLLLRESNISPENYNSLTEFHVYDLILDSKHMLSENFKKYINKILYFGDLKDISRGGCGIKCQGIINFEDEFGIFYIKFNFNFQFKKQIKFGLLSHLRNISFYDGYTTFHFAFLKEIKPEIWNLLRNDLSPISQNSLQESKS